MDFSEKLYDLRKQSGLSQKELAKKLGVAQASINYWEKGQRTPSIDMVYLIASYFGVSVDYLLGLEMSNGLCGMTTFVDEIDYYTEELGKFLYYNPEHKPLFDSVMEVKSTDVTLIKQILDRINGKS